MKKMYNHRRRSRSNGSRNSRSTFSVGRKKPTRQVISESDLIRSIEYSKRNAPAMIEDERYVPSNTFDSFNIDFQLKKNIFAKGYKTPTPIQDQAIPYILEGKDIIGIANTGTGKTAAFLIPLIDKVIKDRDQRVIIIAPTRELGEQINTELNGFVSQMGIRSALLIGGKSIYYQIKDLKRNPNFVIGTPGRIKDMIERRVLRLSDFNNVVLDETDRMVDIGFVKEIKMFISLLPSNRQSLFFSATVSPKVEDILHSFVNNAITVTVKKQDTSANIYQDYIRVEGKHMKVDQLHNLLTKEEFSKVIVFGNTKWGVQKLADELVSRGLKVEAIHGDKRQSQRSSILNRFRKNEINVLLATDVAARGLDINNISHVINYDLPDTYDDYIHRIGRTGRTNKSGTALTFVYC
jgi:superfamily II DNA/RNA helicase